MMYLTFAEYQAYGGTLTETEFNRFEFKAENKLDDLTFNRLKSVPSDERVKRCMYELILYMHENDNGGSTTAVTSFSNDGYSATFAGQKSADEQMFDIVADYFMKTDLMYCGADGEVGTYSATPIEKGWEYLMVRSEK